MPQELLFELNGARVTPHIATFGGTSYQISNIGSVRVMQRKRYNPLAVIIFVLGLGILAAGIAKSHMTGLVARFSQIAGYRCLSLMRAFLVVNCQSALVWLALRSCSQAAISSMRICLLGMRRLRHWDVRTPSSDSARLSQLPCFGVSCHSKRSTSRLASRAG